ncbi:MAG: tetratricopeptide repeat protein, partial [Vulcanimicrobiota bacterium]
MAFNNFIGKRKWKSQFETGVEAFNSGDYAAAETSLSNALEHAGSISEKDDSFGVTALLLGQVYRRTERFEEADEMTQSAFDHYESVFGSTDPRTVKAHMAMVLARPERSHVNLDVRKATYELARTEFGATSWQAIRTAALALESFTVQERGYISQEVKEACSEILGVGRSNLGAWPPVAEEFAEGLVRIAEYDDAARFMSFQLKINEERYGKKSEEAALIRLKMGELFLNIGKPEKAEISFSRAIEALRLKLGPRSEQVQSACVSLARALVRQKKLAEAEPYLNEALVALRPNQVSERIEVLLGLLEYKCLIAGSDGERGALWQELEAFWERAEDELIRESIFEGLLAAQQRLQQAWELRAADRFLNAVLTRVRQWRGHNHPAVAQVLMELCSCAVGAGERKKAETYLEQSLALDEEADNLIRAVHNLARMGDWKTARETAHRATRLMNIEPRGLQNGRREARLAEAMLLAGETDLASIYSDNAESQLPLAEHSGPLAIRARVKVITGEWAEADRLFGLAAEQATDPYHASLIHLHRAWALVQSSEFVLARDSLNRIKRLSDLRPDHPVCFQLKALEAQLAFYRGNVYEGKELREQVQAFLQANENRTSASGLAVLSLLDPFAPEESALEENLGQEILECSEFPQHFYFAYPVVDVAILGLRHLVRALHFQGKTAQARERLEQYRERFFSQHEPKNPNAGLYYLTAALLAEGPEERAERLEAATESLSRLSKQHVALFASLVRLGRCYMEFGDAERALAACQRAFAIRQTPQLREWLGDLERGLIPPSEIVEPSVEPSSETLSESEAPSSEPSLEPLTEPSVDSENLEPTLEQEAVREPSVEPVQAKQEPSEESTPPEAIAAFSTTNVSELPLARILSERAEPPSEEEIEEFLSEIQARFGEHPAAHREARVLLALRLEEGSSLAEELWDEALELSGEADALHSMEFRAREVGNYTLLVQTLNEQLRRESEQFGENSADTLNTQMKLAGALEMLGQLHDAYRRLTMVTEILRSWFGGRSRRLLEPLIELMRLAEALDDTQAAYEHHLERHRILESGEGNSEELFRSRISLLPLRARLAQMDELMQEVGACEAELSGFDLATVRDFARTLQAAARRADELHWRADTSVALLEAALRHLPEGETKLGSTLRIMLSEGLYRKDYRSQATRVRGEAVDLAGTLEADDRAELYHLAAESCVRLGEIEIARALAERVLEERIAEEGRKDIWAGRALLILAEADLLTFRLEGTETEIGMSAPSIRGTRFWGKALALKLQALFFLGRYEEAFALLKEIPEERRLSLHLRLAVWRGEAADAVRSITGDKPTPLAEQWRNFENLPLESAVTMLEFFARAGQTNLVARGLTRIWGRLTRILPTDIRHARVQLLGAGMQFSETDWEGAASTLLRALEILPQETIAFPEGLVPALAREALTTCYIMDGRATSALAQAQQATALTAELLGEEDVRAIAAKVKLAQCARALGSHDDALVLLDEILTPLQDHLGETHVILREVYHGLARTFLDQGDVDSARLSAEEALRIDKECRGLSFHFIQDLELLADIEQAEDIPEAINLLDTALELSEQVLPENHSYQELLAAKRHQIDALEETPVPSASTLSVDEEAIDSTPPVESAEQLFVDVEAEPAEQLFVVESEDYQAPPVTEAEPEQVEAGVTLEELFAIEVPEEVLEPEPEPEPEP